MKVVSQFGIGVLCSMCQCDKCMYFELCVSLWCTCVLCVVCCLAEVYTLCLHFSV